MEENSRNLNKLCRFSVGADHRITGVASKKNVQETEANEAKDCEDDEECDSEAWTTLSEGFKEAQSILDCNRVLIQQVNENQRSKAPGNLVKNVSLIREINSNISKVKEIYSDLSVKFSDIVQQRRSVSRNDGNCSSSRGNESSADSG